MSVSVNGPNNFSVYDVHEFLSISADTFAHTAAYSQVERKICLFGCLLVCLQTKDLERFQVNMNIDGVRLFTMESFEIVVKSPKIAQKYNNKQEYMIISWELRHSILIIWPVICYELAYNDNTFVMP